MLKIIRLVLSTISLIFISSSFIVNELYWVGLVLSLPLLLCYRGYHKSVIKTMFCITLITFPIVFYNAFYWDSIQSFSYWIALTLSICLALGISRLGEVKVYVSVAPFFVVTCYFCYLFFIGKNVTTWLPNNSENFIPVSLYLGYASFLFLSKRKKIDNLDLFLSTIILFFSIIAIGRSGIICSSIIFMYITYNRLNSIIYFKNKIIRYVFVFIVVAMTSVLMYIIVQFLIENDLLSRLLEKGLESNARIFIAEEYLSIVTVDLSIFTGLPAEEVHNIQRFGYNLHNSYLNSHSKFGFFYVITFFYISFKIFSYTYKNKEMGIYLCLLVAIYIRAAIDIQIFTGRFDWIIFCLYFLYLADVRERDGLRK